MNRHLVLSVALILWLAPLAARAADTPQKTGSLPGEQFARQLSLITGVAISPLMGMGGVGAYQYFQARPEARAQLPWFAHPLFWAPALLLVGACFLKDTAGTILPTALKKPLDVADAVENKISGLVATGAFVPFVSTLVQTGGGESALLGGTGMAAADLSWLYNALMIPISMVAFFIVFLASNAINILILLSPFTTVDAALKSFRTAVLASVAASAWANPWVGAAWAVIIVLISYLIAGWSFRLSHFGLVFVWDFCTLRRKRFTPDPRENKLFLSRRISKVPARTYGRLVRNEKGLLVLNYRPWLILPRRTLVLPEGTYAVGQGMFFSEIHRLEGDDSTAVLLLPPRYRSHEQEVADLYRLAGVRPIGLRAVWAWIKGLFGGREPATP